MIYVKNVSFLLAVIEFVNSLLTTPWLKYNFHWMKNGTGVRNFECGERHLTNSGYDINRVILKSTSNRLYEWHIWWWRIKMSAYRTLSKASLGLNFYYDYNNFITFSSILSIENQTFHSNWLLNERTNDWSLIQTKCGEHPARWLSCLIEYVNMISSQY